MRPVITGATSVPQVADIDFGKSAAHEAQGDVRHKRFVRGGYVDHSGSLNNVGAYGGYWSQANNSSTNAYYLDFGGSSVYPSTYGGRYYGFSLRCVAIGS